MSYGSPKKNSSPPLRRSEPNLACSNDINDNISQRKRKRGDEADLQRMENMMLDMKSMFSELVSQQEQHNIKIDALHSALEGIRSQNCLISAQNAEIQTQNNDIRNSREDLAESVISEKTHDEAWGMGFRQSIPNFSALWALLWLPYSSTQLREKVP
ncbi:unnamed protein product [Arctia plantaginis]|uniref:Uncharacterized protein n=1 Tax=Arctia plantaginis TaxID=874455 RepID=A0A8S0Z156_ARCPL|nr:unnamed protein product [Arctia plantaginis]